MNRSYTWCGNGVGLLGRHIRNLCDPVTRALVSLLHMASTRFANIQSLAAVVENAPGVSFDLAIPEQQQSTNNVYLMAELKTP
ncbi:uncharacterized protein N7511_009363 [Penicillium nucicola]|uniref:uncharacterized protein n=1 Tax=Penicillium nucicola TaxID=1850975 RepID=UPI0025450314|nr:uncharacterized protein N7511_009363 [Penicillium nucicola]KAJ5747667.1 hypothetical protein N7511_009363 [Penicillium nucicola]